MSNLPLPASSVEGSIDPVTLPRAWVTLARSQQHHLHQLCQAVERLEARGRREDRIDVLLCTAAVAHGEAQALCSRLDEDTLNLLPWVLVRGIILSREQQLIPAIQLLNLVVTETRLRGDAYLLTWGLIELSRAQGMSGQLSRATENLREVFSILERHPSRVLEYRALLNMGMVYTQEKDHERSTRFTERGLEVSRRLGDPQAIAHSLLNLAESAIGRGRLSDAERWYTEALSLVDGTRWTRTQALLLAGQGMLRLLRGEFDAGIALLERSNTQLRRLGDDFQIARQELWLVENLADAGRDALAVEQCKRAVARCQRAGLGHIESQGWSQLGALYAHQGLHELANDALQQCITRMRACMDERVAATQAAAERSHIAMRSFQKAAWDKRKRQELEEQNRSLAEALAERERLQEELEAASLLDPLTGAGNRRAFNRQLDSLLVLSAREKRPLSMVILDADEFKQVNDRYGHPVGDEVLKALCGRVRQRLRASDFFARWGGEEFVFLLYGTDAEGARRCAEDVRAFVGGRPFTTSADEISVTVSIGVATTDPRGGDARTLIQRADDALLVAKRSGRDRVVVSPSG